MCLIFVDLILKPTYFTTQWNCIGDSSKRYEKTATFYYNLPCEDKNHCFLLSSQIFLIFWRSGSGLLPKLKSHLRLRYALIFILEVKMGMRLFNHLRNSN